MPNKDWYGRNRERVAKTRRDWYERNRERCLEKGRAWRLKNREKKLAQDKAWYKRNIGSYTEKARKRRARKRNAKIPLTAKEKEKLRLLDQTRLELQKETGMVYHLDHIIPLVHGGLHHPVNLRILDGLENSLKKDKLLPEAIALAPEHFRLYSERIGPERAWEFVRQIAKGLRLGEDDLDALITGKPLKSKPTLEDFFV
jgi:hypothetical protein